jgi:ketosteroid isomerase-like protein
MENKILESIVFMTIVTLFISCKPKTEEVSIDKDQIKNEIQAIENRMAVMFNERSVKAEEYYAPDAISFNQNKLPLMGIGAIEKSIKEDLANFPKGHQIAFVVNEIFPSNDGIQVVEIGNYRVSDSTSTALYTGNFIAVFEKKDGKYVCIREMSASDKNIDPKKE